jgi:hypothetical protein
MPLSDKAKKKGKYKMGKEQQVELTVGSKSGGSSKRQKKRARRMRGLEHAQR